MTVPATSPPIVYFCDGSQDFAFGFSVSSQYEVMVYLTLVSTGAITVLSYPEDFTVTGTPTDWSGGVAIKWDFGLGGTVHTVASYSSDYTLTITTNVPITQESHFYEGMPTLSRSFEEGLDKLTRIAKQLASLVPDYAGPVVSGSDFLGNDFRADMGFTSKELSTAVNPPGGYQRIYPKKSDHKWYMRTSAGVETQIPTEGADADYYYVTLRAATALPNSFNLGGLATGVPFVTSAAGIATLSSLSLVTDIGEVGSDTSIATEKAIRKLIPLTANAVDMMEYATDGAAQAAYVTDAPSSIVDSQTDGDVGGTWNDRKDLAGAYTPSTSFTLVRMDVAIVNATGAATGLLTMKIYSDSAGSPGTVLATSTNTVNFNTVGTSYEFHPFYFSGLALTGSTVYWIALLCSVPVMGGNAGWQLKSTGTKDIFWSDDGAAWTLKYDNYLPNFKSYSSADLQVYSESSVKTQGSYSLKAIASDAAIGLTLTNTLASSINMAIVDTLYFDIRSTRTGSNIKIGIHDSISDTTTEITPNITAANEFQTVEWDISGVSYLDKSDIDKIIITVVNDDSANTFYVDDMLSTGPGFGAGASWGQISGSIASQGDLVAALATKPTASLATVVGDPGLDTEVPTVKAVRDALDAIGGGTMVYPGAGIAKSTGSAWATSLSDPVTAAHGGTGKSSWTQYAIPYASDTEVIGEIVPSQAGYLYYNGAGEYLFSAGTGATLPGGAVGSIQVNYLGAFGGYSNFTWDYASSRLGLRGFQTPVGNGNSQVRIMSDGSSATAAINNGDIFAQPTMWSFFDNKADDINTAVIQIHQIQRTNPGSGTIIKTGIGVYHYGQPDNGGDVSGIHVVQTGGGDGISVYKTSWLERPSGYTEYSDSWQGALEAGTTDQSFAILAMAGIFNSPYAGQAIWTRVDNASSKGILVQPNDGIFNTRVAFEVGSMVRNAPNTNTKFRLLMNGQVNMPNNIAIWMKDVGGTDRRMIYLDSSASPGTAVIAEDAGHTNMQIEGTRYKLTVVDGFVKAVAP